VIELLIKVFASYLVGSLIGSLIVGRLRGGVDIRTLGSGNAGGTNALRTQGRGFALWVVLIDVGKGLLATRVIAPLSLSGMGLAGTAAAVGALREWLPVACGFAAIIGHIYPVWHGFRGGKGVATLVGVLLGIDPLLLLLTLLTWLVAAMLLGFVGLASMLAAAAVPLYVIAFDIQPQAPIVAFGIAVALLVVYTHRGNIARMIAGTEPRARRLWLFGRER
jgi:acyl phosphate:glycerol-3-phosphate acyltransferase